MLTKRLQEQQAKLDAIVKADLPRVNKMLTDRKLQSADADDDGDPGDRSRRGTDMQRRGFLQTAAAGALGRIRGAGRRSQDDRHPGGRGFVRG